MGQFRLKFRVMNALALVPSPWCDEWESWFFPPGTQLHWVLCAAWQYYMMNHTFLSDEAYDVLARMLLRNYDWLERKGHQHLKHCPKSALESGGSLYREVSNFPTLVKMSGSMLYDQFMHGNIRPAFAHNLHAGMEMT